MLAPQPTLTESQKNDLRLEAGRLESSARNYYVVGGSLIGLGILGAGVTFWVDYDSNKSCDYDERQRGVCGRPPWPPTAGYVVSGLVGASGIVLVLVGQSKADRAHELRTRWALSPSPSGMALVLSGRF
ncbi:MAG TPA: hypothetical protein VKN99_14680 [Polyangia bacterium]|nr:hypothetical protein [Polyangia bacterium]